MSLSEARFHDLVDAAQEEIEDVFDHSGMDVDLENPDESISSGMFTGFAYTVGYARATMQAALANQSN